MKPVEARIADWICALVLIVTVSYFGANVIAAWLRGAFQVVTR